MDMHNTLTTICLLVPTMAALRFQLHFLRKTRDAAFLTGAWGWGVALVAASSFLVSFAASLVGTPSLDNVDVRFWIVMFGAHIFSSTAPFLVWYQIRPFLTSPISRALALFSFVLITAGGMAEITAHFHDGWRFFSGSDAASGTGNYIFSICLVGGFSFLSAALFPTSTSIIAAFIPPLTMASFGLFMEWTDAKGLVYGLQGVTSVLACATFILKFQSWWPLLYFAQAINIVRSSKRIMAEDCQSLHITPSVYGWFSYVVPFGLAVHRGDLTLRQLGFVLAACVASVILTDKMEDAIVGGSTLLGWGCFYSEQ